MRVWSEERRNRSWARRGIAFADERRLTRSYMTAWALLFAEDPSAARGAFLEFGVYYGTSVACMHDALGQAGIPGVRIYGFDSFEGLPASASKEAGSPWFPGQFRSSLRMTQRYLASKGVPRDSVTLIKGWFSDTATPETRRRYGMERASVIMIDCDLYSSTKEALTFCAPLIGSHAVMYFDDWNAAELADKGEGERRAFEEFLAENPDLRAEERPELNYRDNGDEKVFLLRRLVPA